MDKKINNIIDDSNLLSTESKDSRSFLFFSDELRVDNKPETVRVSKGVKKKEELFELFSARLNFPSYFGNNWDALFDCLKKQSALILLHEDLPFNENSNERKVYICLLYDLLTSLGNSGSPRMHVYFPDKYKNEIHSLLGKMPLGIFNEQEF